VGSIEATTRMILLFISYSYPDMVFAANSALVADSKLSSLCIHNAFVSRKNINL